MADKSDQPPGPVLVWEKLYEWDHADRRWVFTAYRTKIPGGWLGGTDCFVPDPEHRWDDSLA